MAPAAPARIDLDASRWRDVLDFYRAVLKAIEAPARHACSADALMDSIVFGHGNGLQPPFDLVIHDLHARHVAREIDQVRWVLAVGRAEFRAMHGRDVEVSIRLEGQDPVR